ncbi:MAG: ABC transporter substrate-binding protein [Fibrobacterales bacterium]
MWKIFLNVVLITALNTPGTETTYPFSILINSETVTLPKEPQRIISMAPNMTETLFALGAGSKVVGRSFYCDFPAAVKNIPNVGHLYAPNLEKILTLKPDLIIAATHYSERSLTVLRQAGIPVVSQPTPTSIAEIYSYIQRVGSIINHTDQAHTLVTDLKNKMNSIARLTDTLSHKPSVYYAVGAGRGGDYTPGGDTYLSDFITLCGGKNIAQNLKGWRYNIENLLINDPQIIIGDSLTYKTMTNQSNYKNLTVIKSKNYIIIEKELFTRMGPRLIQNGADTLLKIFHPTVYKDSRYGQSIKTVSH